MLGASTFCVNDYIFPWLLAVDEALCHPYLAPLHDINEEPVCPTPFSFDFEQPSFTEENIKELIWRESVNFNPDIWELSGNVLYTIRKVLHDSDLNHYYIKSIRFSEKRRWETYWLYWDSRTIVKSSVNFLIRSFVILKHMRCRIGNIILKLAVELNLYQGLSFNWC